jgi:peptidoglycan/LPS O-acetylase OafA/YrhL
VYFQEKAPLSRVLSLGPVVFLGSISYGFYLFHLVLYEAAKSFASTHGIGNSHHQLALPVFAAAVLLSWLSFIAYERPIIRWGQGKARQLAQYPNSTPAMASGPVSEPA